MTVRILAQEKWQSYCDQISKGLVGKHAYIEVGRTDVRRPGRGQMVAAARHHL